jgi:uncharacterized membrane protein
MPPRPQLVAGMIRFVKVAAVCVAVTAVLSVLLGLVLRDSVTRSLSVGFYIAACVMMILGVVYGLRPPVRQEGDQGAVGGLFGIFLASPVRFATPEERQDSLASSAVFVALGLVLALVGVLCDGRHPLA